MFRNNNNNNIVNNINNCTIADVYIRDAIEDMTIQGDQELGSWWSSEHALSYYNNGPQNINITKNHFFNINPDSIWKPIFINSNTNEQKISEIGVYNKTTLGTNEYIKFDPYFKKYFRANNASVVIPWKLNSDEFPHICTKGVLCWAISTLDNNLSETNSVSWSGIPNFVPFYKDGGPYLKLDDDRLLIPDYSINQFIAPERGPFLDNNFVTNSPSGIFGIDYENLTYSFNNDFDNYNNSINLWIPDGDVYSYKENTGGEEAEEKTYIAAPLYQFYTAIYHAITIRRKRSFSRDLNKSRRYKNLAKYLASSPFITKFCINALVRDDIQDIVNQYINYVINLYDALVAISTILNNNSIESNIDYNLQQSQLNNLIKTPSDLFNKLKNKYGMRLAIRNGSISYTEDLANKDDVAITNVFTINTKNSSYYKNKDSYLSLCQNIKVNNYTIGSRINNETTVLDINKFDRSIDILSKTEDGDFVKTNFIPLYDGIEPKWTSKLELNIAMQFVDSRENKGPSNKEWDPENIVFTYILPDSDAESTREPSLEWVSQRTLSDQGYVTFRIFNDIKPEIIQDDPYFSLEQQANRQFSFLWEQVSGPPIKFTDTNISDDRIFDTSSAETVKIVFSDFARYTIRCNIWSPFGRFTKYKTFFVTNIENKFHNYYVNEYGDETKQLVNYTDDQKILNTYTPDRINYGGPILEERLQQEIPIVPNQYNFKFIKASAFKKIAINARGLVWFIDTGFKVARYGYLEKYIERLSGPIYKVMCSEGGHTDEPIPRLSQPFDIYNEATLRGRSLSLEYIISSPDSSATLYVDKIILENIRNGSDECSQCLSTYGSDMIGLTSQGDSVGQKTLSIERITNGFTLSDLINDKILSYSLPNYSLDYSPKLHKYGRYVNSDFLQPFTGFDSLAYSPLLSTATLGTVGILGTALPDSEVFASKNQFYPSITGYDLAAERTNRYDEENQPGQDVSKYKICYQKALDVIASGDIDRDFYINFTKGIFHPVSGWIGGGDNRSYVLKFNTGARDSFSFKGPAILDLTTSDLSFDISSPNLINATIKQSLVPNTFSSSISVGIAKHVRWDPVCECPPPESATEAEKEQFRLKTPFRILQNQIHKEYADQPGYAVSTFSSGNEQLYNSWHGYRNLGGGYPKAAEVTSSEAIDVNDEFVFNKSNLSYKNNTFQYEFAVTGPANKLQVSDSGLYDLLKSPGEIPSNIRDKNLNLRDPRVNNFNIKDIEVNINFLNYVNTQDLIIWLEVTPCASEIKRQTPLGNPPRFPSPITAPSQFINQTLPTTIQRKDTEITWVESVVNSNILLNDNTIANTGVGEYLKSLIDINSNNPGKNFKIYLLNQEYIQNNKYNFSINFSDHANINARFNDFTTNQNLDCIGPYLNNENIVLDDNGSITPTFAAVGYDDIDHHINSNIIKKNYLYVTNNTFSKLYGKPLFLNPGPEDGPCANRTPIQQGPSLDSTTTFTLKVAIVDEPDIMDNYDNIINSAILTNFIPEQNKATSSNMFNNLCNWEIILHTNSTRKHIPHSIDQHTYGTNDVLSLIEYHSSPENNGYYGYNFIADLTDKQFLLPIANLNAPYQYIQDFDLCSSATYDISEGNLLLSPPSFPTSAIASVLAGIAAAGAFMGGVGLAGAGALGGFINNGYKEIFNYFQEARRWRNLDRRLGQIYNISHNNYPFGSPEKILLNLSKDGCFWYNAEAVIFRLSNTPVMDRHNFKPLPLYKITESEPTDPEHKLIQLLSEFKYSVIEKPIDTIDSIFIKYNISLTCEELNNSINTNSIVTENDTYDLAIGDIFTISVINRDIDGDGIIDECEYNDEIITNNTYILKESGQGLQWSTSFKDFLSNKNIITVNTMLSYNNWWNNNIIIKIDNPIMFDILNINDSIEIFNDDDRLNETHNFYINGKAKVLLENKYCTILSLYTTEDIPIQPITGLNRTSLDFIKQNNTLRNSSNNTIAIISPIPDTSGNINSNPWSQWKFESNNTHFYDTETIGNGIVPQIGFSTNSRGSYGDISPKIQKNYLHYVVQKNKINKLYELFNNQYNYKKLYNDIQYLPSSTGVLDQISGATHGYSYSLNDIISNQPVINNDIFNFISKNLSDSVSEQSLETINSYKYKTLLLDHKYEILYLNNPNFSGIYNNYSSSSSISIDGVGTLYTPIECDPIPEDRIAHLESDEDDDLLQEYGGDLSKYSEFFAQYPSIATALTYYESISSSSTSATNIEKITTVKNNLELLFEERNSLIKLKQRILGSNIDPSNTKSNIKYNIIDSNNSVNRYNITKTINNNYYWIHIDPKQSCSIAEELRPKVLKATKYSCAYLNPNIDSVSIDNNICPLSASTRANDGGDENIKLFDDMSFPGDPVLGITYGYYIPSGVIDDNKADLQGKYPTITKWKEESIYRTFYMNSTNDIVNLARDPDYVIYVEEIYDVAVPEEHTMTFQEALDSGLIKNDGSADTNNVSGWGESCGNSPGGLGLINTLGQRLAVPSRVCNIFNLDDIETLKVKFRKIPRILRGIDFLGTIFRYGATSQYRQLILGSPLQPLETSIGQGSLNNQLYYWQCLELNKDNQLVKTELSDLMAVMNEMTFRAFYGSADGIENRNRTLMQGDYLHQLIPFEFFTKPSPPPPEE